MPLGGVLEGRDPEREQLGPLVLGEDWAALRSTSTCKGPGKLGQGSRTNLAFPLFPSWGPPTEPLQLDGLPEEPNCPLLSSGGEGRDSVVSAAPHPLVSLTQPGK